MLPFLIEGVLGSINLLSKSWGEHPKTFPEPVGHFGAPGDHFGSERAPAPLDCHFLFSLFPHSHKRTAQKKKLIDVPNNRRITTLSTPSVILDFTGGKALQALSEWPQQRWAGIFAFKTTESLSSDSRDTKAGPHRIQDWTRSTNRVH